MDTGAGTVEDGDAGGLRLRVLGGLHATMAGDELALGPLKQQVVLATLLCRANSLVSVSLLARSVWGAKPPASARKNLQTYISALRKVLGESGGTALIEHNTVGYRFRATPEMLDLLRFESLVRAGRQALRLGAHQHAAALLGQALDLQSGPVLEELLESEVLQEEVAGFAVRRVAVYEDWAEAALEFDRPHVVADVLADVVRDNPLRERLRAAQMTALYRAGRRAEALASYDEMRQFCARDLGIDVSPVLVELYRSMLGSHGEAGTAPAPREARRTSLPPALSDFSGRAGILGEVVAALAADDRQRQIVLTGPPGVGKSALAVQIAHRVERLFPDGRFFVRLRGQDGAIRRPGAILAELCRVTGLTAMTDRLPQDEEETVAVLRSWLYARRVILIFDGAPDEASVRDLLPGTGACAAVVTSTSRLAGLGPLPRYEIPPFERHESLELLGRLVGGRRLASEPVAADRIGEVVGDLPLAIRACGSRLAVLPHVTIGEFAERLQGLRAQPALLDELAVGDLGMRARLEAWCRSLPESLQVAMGALAGLPTPVFTLPEAAAVLRSSEHETLRTLERLMEVCAVACPQPEVLAHTTFYEIPVLHRVFARGGLPDTSGAGPVDHGAAGTVSMATASRSRSAFAAAADASRPDAQTNEARS